MAKRVTAAEAARRIAEQAPTADDYRVRGETPPWVTLCGNPNHAGMGPHGHGDGSHYPEDYREARGDE